MIKSIEEHTDLISAIIRLISPCELSNWLHREHSINHFFLYNNFRCFILVQTITLEEIDISSN